MKMRTGKIRCERCKFYIVRGDRGTRVHGRIWHLSCAVKYTRERQIARGELTPV